MADGRRGLMGVLEDRLGNPQLGVNGDVYTVISIDTALGFTTLTCRPSVIDQTDSSRDIPGINFLHSYLPIVGDVVQVLSIGGSPYVVGMISRRSTESQQVDNTASASTTSTTYTDLAGSAGPAITGISLRAGQVCFVEVTARIKASSNTGAGLMSFAVSGAAAVAAVDNDAAVSFTVDEVGSSKRTRFVAPASGLYDFTSKYRSSNGAVTATFVVRRIIAEPK